MRKADAACGNDAIQSGRSGSTLFTSAAWATRPTRAGRWTIFDAQLKERRSAERSGVTPHVFTSAVRSRAEYGRVLRECFALELPAEDVDALWAGICARAANKAPRQI